MTKKKQLREAPIKVGRKSNYYDKVEPYFKEIAAWRKDGQTEENIAKLLGVSYRTLCEYKVKFPQFAQLLKDSKAELIVELETTLFQMALGRIKVTETKKYIQVDANGDEKTKIEETVKDIAPHPTLLIFALKNLSTKWRDNHDVTLNDMSAAMQNMDSVFNEMRAKLPKENKDE